MLLLVCTYIISSKRVHHVTTYLIHGVPTRLSVSRVENRVYMYYAAPFYRSASNQESSPFPSPPLPSCLAPSLSCSSSQLSVSFFFFIRSFVQAFSLSLFFFTIYPLSPVSLFYLIIYLFSIYFHLTVHIFVYVSCPFFPSPILLFSSAFDLYPSFAPRRLSSTLSFFGSKNEEQRLQFCLSTSLKNFFRINFRYLFFFLLLFMLFILLCTSSIFFSNHLLFSFFFFAFHFIFLSVSLSFYTLFSRFYSIVKFFNFSFLLSLKSLIPFT